MHKTWIHSIFFCLLFSGVTFSQVSETLSFDAFISLVKTHHPIASKADIVAEIGKLQVLQARGGFDPQLYAQMNQKEFAGSDYYQYLDGGVQIPTWFGLSFLGGIEQADGTYLNPERTLPPNGLTYAGVNLSLGQGLLMDQRRADLRKAQAAQKMSEEDRRLMLNDLLLRASETYYHWQAIQKMVEINEEALRLAEERFTGVEQSAQFGDSPFIDTLEAGIQVQNRKLNLQESRLQLKNQRALVSTFLWMDNVVPVELEEHIVPQTDFPEPMETLRNVLLQSRDTVLTDHPALRKMEFRLDQLDIERRLRAERLRPMLDVKYNLLNEPFVDNFANNYTFNNYNFGVAFRFPLFLRKERGALQISKLQMRDVELDYQHQMQQLGFQTKRTFNVFKTTTEQLQLYQRTVRDLELLLDGERTKFNGGESSLFLVNSREMNYINGRIKLVDLQMKNSFSLLQISHSLGNLPDEL